MAIPLTMPHLFASVPTMAQAMPPSGLVEIFQEGLGSLPLAEMEAELANQVPALWSEFDLDLWRELAGELYRADAQEGARDWHRKVGLRRLSLIWSRFVSQHQKESPPLSMGESVPDWFPYLQEHTDLLSALQEDMRQAGLSPERLLKSVRQNRSLRRQAFHLGDFYEILCGELKLRVPLPFPLLKKVAELLRQDIRRYVVLSNRSFHPQRSHHLWAHPHYPIYLEDDLDLKVLNALNVGHRRHRVGSFGWHVWTLMKDPQQYRSIKTFSEAVGLGPGTIRSLILQNSKPSNETFEKLASAGHASTRFRLISAYNDAHFHELARKIEEAALFPGQTIFIGRNGDDKHKLERFLQRPAHPARFLLGARNLFPEIPGIVVLARELHLSSSALITLEAGKVPVHRESMSTWYKIYQRFGAPLELLKIGAAIEYGIDEGDPAWEQVKAAPRKKPRGKLPDNLSSAMNRRVSQKLSRPSSRDKKAAGERPARQILLSTLERPVTVERRQKEDGSIQLVYRREYTGRMDKASIQDGEFLAEIAIINHVRDMKESAILEIELTWPQNVNPIRMGLLKADAAQAAEATKGIQQVVLIWQPLKENQQVAEKQERTVLFSEDPMNE